MINRHKFFKPVTWLFAHGLDEIFTGLFRSVVQFASGDHPYTGVSFAVEVRSYELVKLQLGVLKNLE